jgi:predicted nucleic acid-binding protein
MRIFIDTNVILEFFMHREEYEVAEKLLKELRRRNAQLFMSVGSFYTIHFIILKYLHKEQGLVGEECLQSLRIILSKILQMFDIAEHDKNSLIRGISDTEYKDLEDSCQYQVAQKVDCEALVSFNISDYSETTDGQLRIYTPQQFIDQELIER